MNSGSNSLERASVLLVDDRVENLVALEGLLEGMNIETVRATSGNEALAATLRKEFCLVLLDVQMPGMDGFETAQLLRGSHRTRHIPIIFITAGMDQLNHQFRGYETGGVDYLIKPFDPVILRSKVSVFRDLYLQRKELELHRNHLQELVERQTADLRQAAEELERRVAQRTGELLRANEQLESFAYSVSHDLRAPLRHINSFSQILEEEYGEALDQQGRDLIRRIVNGCNRMGHLIDAILELSRASRKPLERVVVEMERVAREVVAELREMTGWKGEVTISPLPAAEADPHLIRQVLVNLVGNAMKFSRTREVPRISIESRVDGGKVEYLVQDNGVGFDMRYADRLFGVFQRLHPADQYEGSGVGLAIVQNIITRHGGSIRAESEPERGATFIFTLGDSPPSAG